MGRAVPCQFTRTTSRATLFWEHTHHQRTLSVLDDINTPTDRIRYRYLTYPRYGGGPEEDEECWVSFSLSLSMI